MVIIGKLFCEPAAVAGINQFEVKCKTVMRRTLSCLLAVLVLLVPGFLWADNLFDLIAADANIDALTQAAEKLTVEDINAVGTKVNDRDESGRTALMYAASWNDNPAVIEALLVAGASINDRNEEGWTALMGAAIESNNPAVVDALLAAGAKVNERTEEGGTALLYAAKYQDNPAVILALLDANADVTIKDEEGKTAWDYMKENEDLKGTDAYWRLNNLRFE